MDHVRYDPKIHRKLHQNDHSFVLRKYDRRMKKCRGCCKAFKEVGAALDRNLSSPTCISTCKDASLRRNVYSWRSEIFITTVNQRAYYHAIHTLIGNIFVNSDCCRRDTWNVIRCCRLICSMHPYRVRVCVCVCVCL